VKKARKPTRVDLEHKNVLDALELLVAYVKRTGGFMEHRDQLVLRQAEAELVKAGRLPR
jgi:hypothetical protein